MNRYLLVSVTGLVCLSMQTARNETKEVSVLETPKKEERFLEEEKSVSLEPARKSAAKRSMEHHEGKIEEPIGAAKKAMQKEIEQIM